MIETASGNKANKPHFPKNGPPYTGSLAAQEFTDRIVEEFRMLEHHHVTTLLEHHQFTGPSSVL
jgi:hypothetical protein